MVTTYSLRVRLRAHSSPDTDQLHLIDSMFTALDRRGVAEDAAPVGLDGTYILWLAVTAEGPLDAVGRAISLIEEAQGETRPTGRLDEIVSIEVAAGTSPDDSPVSRAAI